MNFKIGTNTYTTGNISGVSTNVSSGTTIVGPDKRTYRVLTKQPFDLSGKVLALNLLKMLALTIATLGIPLILKQILHRDNMITKKFQELKETRGYLFHIEALQPQKPGSIAAIKKTEALSSTEEVLALLEKGKQNFQTLHDNEIDAKLKQNYANKLRCMDLMIAQVKKFSNLKPQVTLFQLDNYSRYEKKEWAGETLNINPIAFTCTDAPLEYNTPGRTERAISQDPAHKHLGGAALTYGCVVEELQALEMPYFMALLLKTNALETRSGGTGPGEGFPTPLILDGLYRFFDANALYYPQIYEGNVDVTILDQPYPSPLVCLAAPDLRTHNVSRYDPKVVGDLFNTFLANFELIRKFQETKGADAPTIVDAVKVGGGAFKNDETLIYCMQKLAAMHAGIPKVRLHKMENIAKAEQLFAKVQKKMRPDATIAEWLAAFSDQ